MYLESIGNPRKFTRLARRTAAAKPLVVVQGARHSGAPAGPRRPGDAAAARHGVRAAAPGRGDPGRHRSPNWSTPACCSPASRCPPARGWRSSGNSESLGLLTYDACLAEGLRPLPPADLTTAASPADFHAALPRALADDACDAVVVTAIPAVGERSRPGTRRWPRRCARRRPRCPAKPVLVVHVELGGLAEALSAAASTAPQASSATAAAARSEPDAREPAHPRALDRLRPPARPERAARPRRNGARLIPAYPAAERAVRALGRSREVRPVAARRRRARQGPRVRGHRREGRRRAASTASSRAGQGPAASARTETRELLGRYGIDVHRALPAPTRDAAAEPPAPSATRSPSRPPPRTCATAPTSAAYASTWRTRSNCAARTAN